MYYNLEKTADVLGISQGDVNRFREQGKLRAFRDGANWKFRKEDVEKFLTELIKNRSKENLSEKSDLLNESDEEMPTMLADTSSFDSLIDSTADNFAISGSEADDDDLKLVDDDTFDITDDENLESGSSGSLHLGSDSGISLGSDEDIHLGGSSGISLGSDNDLQLGGSDSGLSLLDDLGGDGDDGFVLGGSKSDLNIGTSDSGLSLLDDNAADFSLDESTSVTASGNEDAKQEDSSSQDKDDGGIFELADEASSILTLDKGASPDTVTLLDSDEDFRLAPEAENAQESDSESSSQVINLVDEDPNSLFMTESDDNSGAYGTSEETTDAGFSAPGSGMESAFDFGGTTETTDSASPFGGFSDMGTGGTDESASGSIDFTSIGDGDITGTQTLPVTSGCSYAAGKGCLQEPNFTGMSIGLGLVPCIVLLILAGIGAYELIRSIWSWEQPFGLSGAVLEMFGGLFKLF